LHADVRALADCGGHGGGGGGGAGTKVVSVAKVVELLVKTSDHVHEP
jgi:hypothetical protein